MKCPICGDTLTPSKKNPDYVLCHNCRKKFRLPKKRAVAPAKTAPVRTAPAVQDEDDDMSADKTQVYSREEVQAALRKLDQEKRSAKAASVKAKAAARRRAPEPEYDDDDDDVEFHFRYANIPPKEVREKQEREMRKAYDELLSIGKEEKEKKRHGFFHRRKK